MRIEEFNEWWEGLSPEKRENIKKSVIARIRRLLENEKGKTEEGR